MTELSLNYGNAPKHYQNIKSLRLYDQYINKPSQKRLELPKTTISGWCKSNAATEFMIDDTLGPRHLWAKGNLQKDSKILMVENDCNYNVFIDV